MEVGLTEEAKEVWGWDQETSQGHIQDDAGVEVGRITLKYLNEKEWLGNC